METENTTREGNKYVPLAIVMAGALIAGAIYLNDNGGNAAAVAKAFELKELPSLAKAAGLDKSAFNACVEGSKFADKIAQETAEATELEAPGTPFPIVITKTGKTVALQGALPFDQMKEVIDLALADKLPAEALTKLPKLRPLDATDHLIGSPDAPVVILEYSDLQCPYCKRFHDTMNEVMAEYGQAGQVAWAYRHFPILSNHPNAAKVAEATECAAELGGNEVFWNFLDRVFAAQ